VAAQIALSLLLLVGAGLFVRTLSNLRSAPFGFDAGRLLVVTINPAFSGYTRERAGLFFEQMTERVASLPGVESAALAVMPLLGGSEWGGALTLDNGRRHEPGPMRDAVGPGYFRTVGIPLAEGREFTDADRPGAPPVAVVNESFVRAYLDGGPALGRRIAMGVPAGFPGFTIIGVARDGKHARVRQESGPFWYMPRLQLSPGWNLTAQTLHVRTTGDPTSMVGSVRQTIAAIDSSVTVLGAYTMTDQIEDHLEVERLLATLGLVFGIVAALLASLGLYGVVAYAVTARTREIGVRMALGAESAQILGLFLRQTGRIVACGLVAGLILVAFTVGYLRSVLYGVEPLDWFSVGSAAVVVVVVTGVAAFVPAHRATRINPVAALQ
jgi:predicted permease